MGVVSAKLLHPRITPPVDRERWSSLMLQAADIEEASGRLNTVGQDEFGRRERLIVLPDPPIGAMVTDQRAVARTRDAGIGHLRRSTE